MGIPVLDYYKHFFFDYASVTKKLPAHLVLWEICTGNICAIAEEVIVACWGVSNIPAVGSNFKTFTQIIEAFLSSRT